MFGRRPQSDPAAASAPQVPNQPTQAPSSSPSAADDQQAAGTKSGAAARMAEASDNNSKRMAAAKAVFNRIQSALLERIDASAAAKLPRDELQRQIAELISEIVNEERLSVTSREQQQLAITMVDDMVCLLYTSPSPRDRG